MSHEEYQVVTENGDIFAFDEPLEGNRAAVRVGAKALQQPLQACRASRASRSVGGCAWRAKSLGAAPGKRIAVIIWANEQELVPRMVREKSPGMRSIVPLTVDWSTWGHCVPGALSRGDRGGPLAYQQNPGGSAGDKEVELPSDIMRQPGKLHRD